MSLGENRLMLWLPWNRTPNACNDVKAALNLRIFDLKTFFSSFLSFLRSDRKSKSDIELDVPDFPEVRQFRKRLPRISWPDGNLEMPYGVP